MKPATLIYPLTPTSILLGLKKRGFGANKLNGYGGKVHEGEDPKAAAIRELEEESGIIARDDDVHQVALLRFYFDKEPIFECSVYLTHVWQNEPVETEEMRPEWYPTSHLPFEDMWAADHLWLPLLLNGEKIEAEVNFNADGSEVKEFSYRPATFV
jgi:8-oxo-dGTP diphosphatase